MDDVIEGEAVELTSGAAPLAVQSQGAAVWVPDFAVSVNAMVAKVEAKHDFFRRVMRKGQHYGPIPGTKPRDGEPEKQVLFKAGAELLLTSMGLFIELSDATPPIVRYPAEGEEGEITFRRRCRVFRQTGPLEHERMMVAQAEGSCTSLEVKYRYRDSKRTCPSCGASAIITGKQEYGGGFLCFKKQGGCGAKFAGNDPAIVGQATGRIPNPDLADTSNTILKMADKRALVAATLIATGCSDIFTQDVEPDDGFDAPPDERPPAGEPTRANPVADALAAKELRNMVARKWQNVDAADRQRILEAECGTTDLKAVALPKLQAFLAKSDALLAALRGQGSNGGKPGATSAEPPAPTEHPAEAPDAASEPERPYPTLSCPPCVGRPMQATTRARLFATLGEMGCKAKDERLRWASAYEAQRADGSPITSLADLSDAQAFWLADRAAEELHAWRINNGAD